jgi:two-component system alkaline phosphatase synthesis response regulator PhoP
MKAMFFMAVENNGDEMGSKKVLIVDDEKELLGLVSLHMRMAGFEVLQAADGEAAIKICEESKPDLVILDLMLPELDGWEVCRILRENPATQTIPVMILTARAEVDDRLRGFDMGADDYVTKPFSPRELVARVKRILERCHPKPKQQKNIVAGRLEIDMEDFDVRMKGQAVILTEKEKAILKLMVTRSGELITHEQLIDEVWGQDHIVEYGNIAVHVRHLREKIEEDPEHPKIIKTIKGMGYRFDFQKED